MHLLSLTPYSVCLQSISMQSVSVSLYNDNEQFSFFTPFIPTKNNPLRNSWDPFIEVPYPRQWWWCVIMLLIGSGAGGWGDWGFIVVVVVVLVFSQSLVVLANQYLTRHLQNQNVEPSLGVRVCVCVCVHTSAYTLTHTHQCTRLLIKVQLVYTEHPMN